MPADAYYANELTIAKANGIVQGVGGNRFLPEARITREDMMVILARALAKTGAALEKADPQALASFADGAQISGYARESVELLVSNGVIAGADGQIDPKGYATRAEVAVMLERVLRQ